jgi:hypothetical protein
MKRTIGIIVVAIIAALFYASAWTSEYSISICFALSGIILSLQALATILVVENT